MSYYINKINSIHELINKKDVKNAILNLEEIKKSLSLCKIQVPILEAKIFRLQGDLPRAIEHLESACNQLPNEPEIWITYAQFIPNELGMDAQSDAWEKVIKQFPYLWEGYIYLSRTLYSAGNIKRAEEIIDKGLENFLDNQPKSISLAQYNSFGRMLLNERGNLFFQNKEYENAIESYKSVWKYIDNDVWSHIRVSECYRLSGNILSAWATINLLFDSFHKIPPSHLMSVYSEYIEVLFALKHYAQALVFLESPESVHLPLAFFLHKWIIAQYAEGSLSNVLKKNLQTRLIDFLKTRVTKSFIKELWKLVDELSSEGFSEESNLISAHIKTL